MKWIKLELFNLVTGYNFWLFCKMFLVFVTHLVFECCQFKYSSTFACCRGSCGYQCSSTVCVLVRYLRKKLCSLKTILKTWDSVGEKMRDTGEPQHSMVDEQTYWEIQTREFKSLNFATSRWQRTRWYWHLYAQWPEPFGTDLFSKTLPSCVRA